MSEETKIIHEEKCFCQSQFFKRFSAVALGTFVGGFCAISLHAALNKPPIMPFFPPTFSHHSGYHYMMDGHHFSKHECKCHKKDFKKHLEKKAEFYKELKEKKNQENKD